MLATIVIFSSVALSQPTADNSGASDAGEPGPTVSISDGSADAGNTTTVTITAYNVTDIANFDITVTYDPAIVNVTAADNADGFSSMNNLEKAATGKVRLVSFNTGSGQTGDILLSTLTLEGVGAGQTTLTLTPNELLTSSEGLIDATPYDGVFTVAGAIVTDTTAPSTSGHDPVSGATGVPTDTNITVHVLDDGTGVKESTIVMTVDGMAVTPVITGTPADYTLVYDPPADFGADQLVNVTIDAADLNDMPNVMATDAYSFTVTGKTPSGPTVSISDGSADAGNTTTVTITAYNVTDIANFDITVTYDPAIVNVTAADNADGFSSMNNLEKAATGKVRLVSFNTGSGQTGDILLSTLTLEGVGAGQTTLTLTPNELLTSTEGLIDATPNDGVFTVAGAIVPDTTTAPSTSGHDPVSGATGVPTNTNITVHVLDDGTGVNESTIVMTVDGMAVIPVITGTPADYTLVYDPPADFGADQLVNVTIDAADLNDTPNVMATDAYSFTVAGAIVTDTTTPSTSGHDPVSGATGVPTNTNITVHVLDDGTGVNESTIVMTVDGMAVIPVITGTPADYTLVYDPPADFGADQLVNVTIDAADLNDTPNAMQDIYSFTTATTVTTTIIAIDDAIASTGGNDDVARVMINNAAEVGVILINIQYDPSVVEVVDVADGDFDFITSSIDNVAGVVSIGAMQGASSGLNGDVLLAEVTLQAKGDQGAASALSIDLKELKDVTPQCNSIQADVEDASFTVSCLCGDVNGDGSMLMDDAMYLMKHCVKEPGFEQIDECASDVNGDGNVLLDDAMYLAKHCAGVPGFEELHCCAGQQ